VAASLSAATQVAVEGASVVLSQSSSGALQVSVQLPPDASPSVLAAVCAALELSAGASWAQTALPAGVTVVAAGAADVVIAFDVTQLVIVASSATTLAASVAAALASSGAVAGATLTVGESQVLSPPPPPALPPPPLASSVVVSATASLPASQYDARTGQAVTTAVAALTAVTGQLPALVRMTGLQASVNLSLVGADVALTYVETFQLAAAVAASLAASTQQAFDSSSVQLVQTGSTLQVAVQLGATGLDALPLQVPGSVVSAVVPAGVLATAGASISSIFFALAFDLL
jgi:hypothetical protein